MGTVVDGFGKPIPGVNVSLLGTECVTRSEDSGTFTLRCSTDKGTITLDKEGFVSARHTFDFTVYEQTTLPLQTLIEFPPAAGLFIQKDATYRELAAANLLRTASRKGKEIERTYCLQTKTKQPTTIGPGAVSIFAYQTDGWRLFKMDANRCAYSDKRKASGRWVVGHREKPPVTVELVAEDLSTHSATLEVGHYFAAHWDGFFVPTEPNSDEYKGHWFEVRE